MITNSRCTPLPLQFTVVVYQLSAMIHTSEVALTLWHPAEKGVFREKNIKTHVALCGNFSGPVSATDLVKSSKDAASLVACTRKKFFGWGVRVFCQ